MPKAYRESLLVILVFCTAIIFRLWFITLMPQPYGWDQEEYDRYALKMYWQPQLLASHSYRSYVYPFFLTVLYKAVGQWGVQQPVYIVQAILDALAGVLIYLILRNGNKVRNIGAWIAYILYSVNPFTSGYVGVVLSEVLSGYLIISAVFCGFLFIKKPNILTGLMLGLTSLLVAQVRNAAFVWAIVPIGAAFFYVSFRKKIIPFIFVAVGAVIPLIYPLYVNFRDYKQLSITTVDSIMAREFFNGAILKILPPFTYDYPVEVNQMYWEYYSEYYPNRTKQERKAMADKYMKMGLDILKADPADYIRWRFYKMWYVWQKENIFFYKDIGWENRRDIIFYGNQVLLALSLAGVFFGLIEKNNKAIRYVFLVILGTIGYGTFAFCITHAEYRLTIPFYPLLILSVGYGSAIFIKKIKFLLYKKA